MATRPPTPAHARTRVVVLGVGAMGRLHARVFAGLTDDYRLAGVYDPDAERALETATAHSVTTFADEAQAIAAADLVVIASPIEAHAASAERALASGRHVLVEKPVCGSAAQAFALARSASTGQRLFVGHSERWNPVVRALRSLVAPETIRTIRLRRTAIVRSGREHGVLVSLGVHDIDLVAHLTGAPARLAEVLLADDDRAELVLDSGNARARILVDQHAPVRERSLELVTKDAVYTGDLFAKTLTVTARGVADAVAIACPLVDEEPLVAQARAIARALRGGTEELATGLDGARVMALVEQARTHGTTVRETVAAAS